MRQALEGFQNVGAMVEGDYQVVSGFYEYLLIEPFKIVKRRVEKILDSGGCLVTPVLAGICGSDVLYFKGDKDLTKLQQRLPLVPLHEGVVRGIDTGRFGSVIPFRKCDTCFACLHGMENLCLKSSYMGSTLPGLSRSPFSHPRELIVDVPENVPLAIATLLEPMSIVHRMLEETPLSARDNVAVIGNGLLGRLVIIFLSVLRGMGRDRLHLIGQSDLRLLAFNDIASTINGVKGRQFLKEAEGTFSIVVEAVGGHAMAHSIRQAIALARPRGRIHVFGLADEVKDINFTQIVNKGLILQGFSRARYNDYRTMMDIMSRNLSLITLLERVIDPERFVIRGEDDLMDAFHYVMSRNNNGRVVVAFEEGA